MKNTLEEVKIIYCYDENKTAIHYSKTIKGNSYNCIDCGSELICKEGTKKIKHLAHKNTLHCGGTGESIFHKHWKENLFKAGMYINVANRISKPENVEILEVLNEVSLNKRYNKNWDKEIIVDVLLITEKGEIIVEVNYKNAKNWSKLKSYYDELDILRVYEITVDKTVNSTLKWFCLGEEEEIEKYENEQIKRNSLERMEAVAKREQRKLERAKKKLEKKEVDIKLFNDKLRSGVYKEYKIYFNPLNQILSSDSNNFVLNCLFKNSNDQFEPIILRFEHNDKFKEMVYIKERFKINSGIKSCIVIAETELGFNEKKVIKFDKPVKEEYNNRLYAQLCNIK